MVSFLGRSFSKVYQVFPSLQVVESEPVSSHVPPCAAGCSVGPTEADGAAHRLICIRHSKRLSPENEIVELVFQFHIHRDLAVGDAAEKVLVVGSPHLWLKL